MERILILDDNPQNNSCFIDPLKKSFQVDVAMAISSAKRLIGHFNYDLIVIDVMMPIQNLNTDNELITGLVFYENLKIDNPEKIKKVLFWSIHTDESYNDYFKEKDTNNIDFLQKDLHDDNHLYNKVNEILQKIK